MNRRIRKKKRYSKSLITIENKQGFIGAYIKKKHWNKGTKEHGYMMIDSGDYISVDYLRKNGFEYIAQIFSSNCHITIHKSIDNKNRITVIGT